MLLLLLVFYSPYLSTSYEYEWIPTPTFEPILLTSSQMTLMMNESDMLHKMKSLHLKNIQVDFTIFDLLELAVSQHSHFVREGNEIYETYTFYNLDPSRWYALRIVYFIQFNNKTSLHKSQQDIVFRTKSDDNNPSVTSKDLMIFDIKEVQATVHRISAIVERKIYTNKKKNPISVTLQPYAECDVGVLSDAYFELVNRTNFDIKLTRKCHRACVNAGITIMIGKAKEYFNTKRWCMISDD